MGYIKFDAAQIKEQAKGHVICNWNKTKMTGFAWGEHNLENTNTLA